MTICYATLVPVTFYFKNVIIRKTAHAWSLEVKSKRFSWEDTCVSVAYFTSVLCHWSFQRLPRGAIWAFMMFTHFQEGLTHMGLRQVSQRLLFTFTLNCCFYRKNNLKWMIIFKAMFKQSIHVISIPLSNTATEQHISSAL